jgi:hypothetical protein
MADEYSDVRTARVLKLKDAENPIPVCITLLLVFNWLLQNDPD